MKNLATYLKKNKVYILKYNIKTKQLSEKLNFKQTKLFKIIKKYKNISNILCFIIKTSIKKYYIKNKT